MEHCEALEKTVRGKYARCGEEATDLHHKLPRSRGGKILDKAGEKYHLIRLCRRHHTWVHEHPAQAMAGGLTIDGYVENLNGVIRYRGTEEVLRKKYPCED